MNKASIVTIGNEILIGHTVNTNAAYLAERLLSIGLAVVSERTVGDEIESIVGALRQAAEEAEIIIVTGGLGPTADDLTRQASARFLGVKLKLDERLLKEIECRFKKRGVEMPANNRIQAYMPAGTSIIANKLGTAAGIRAEHKGKVIFVLPGVPCEMMGMFERKVCPEIETIAASTKGAVTVIRKLNCFGAAESRIAELVGEMNERGRNPQIGYTVNHGVVTVHIKATADSRARAKDMAEEDEKILKARLGDFIFSEGDKGLSEVVGEKLAKHGRTLAVAESCTGGLLAAILTDIPGASRYFMYGWVTYSDAAKTSELGVQKALIKRFGAVSAEVAEAMAKGARKRAKTDFSVAITGIAGPAGGSEEKRVGLVYISVDSAKGCEVERYVFAGDRQAIRLRAANTALNMLHRRL